MGDLPILDHVLTAFFIIVGLYAVLVGQKRMKAMTFDERMRIAVYWSNGVLLWVAGLVTCAVWLIGGRSLASLGLTVGHESIGIGLLITLSFLLWFGTEFWLDLATPIRRARLLERWRRDAPILPGSRREYQHYSFIAVAAGVNEEIIARGFLISYLLVILGDSLGATIVAVTLPAIGFGVAHFYQGWKVVARIILLAVAFGAIFVVTKSLLIPIVLHTLIDLLAGYAAMRMSQGHVATAKTASSQEPA